MILVAIGANLPTEEFGPPVGACEASIAALKGAGLEIVKRSRWYKTAPIPVSDQPWYVNGVVAVRSQLGPEAVLAVLHGIEKRLGRIRSVRNAPRVIDLDLLAHGKLILTPMEEGGLALPHPRLQDRAFVLFPLRDVAPLWVHPATGLTVKEMIDALPAGQTALPLE